jgi:hypothetical protein
VGEVVSALGDQQRAGADDRGEDDVAPRRQAERSMYRALIAAGSEIITIGRSKVMNLTLKLSPYFSRFSCMKGSGRKLHLSV